MKHRCPVCGFAEMPFPPMDYNICSCCGTEFGYHDFAKGHQQLRDAWIAMGMPWFSTAMPAPVGWNPLQQLQDLNLNPQVDVANVQLAPIYPYNSIGTGPTKRRRRRRLPSVSVTNSALSSLPQRQAIA